MHYVVMSGYRIFRKSELNSTLFQGNVYPFPNKDMEVLVRRTNPPYCSITLEMRTSIADET